jgi:hypothetical protein
MVSGRTSPIILNASTRYRLHINSNILAIQFILLMHSRILTLIYVKTSTLFKTTLKEINLLQGSYYAKHSWERRVNI